MNKKVLLSSLVASGIVATSLLTGNAKAATNVPDYGNKVMAAVENIQQTETQNSEYIMSVLLETKNPYGKGKNELTRKQVEELLNTKYGKVSDKTIVSKITKADGTEIKEDTEKVGTGSVIELITGRKITVVLYGDITGDGIIETKDSVAIAEHNVNKLKLNKYQEKAAKLTSKSETVNTNDTVRLAFYNVNNLTTDITGKSLLDMKLYPDDLVEKLNVDEILSETIKNINETEGNSEKFSLSLTADSNNIELGFSNDANAKLSELAGTGLMIKLANNLNTYKENLEKIELLVGDKKIEVSTAMSPDESARKFASLFVDEDLTQPENADKYPTIASILGKEIKVRFYFYKTTNLLDTETATATDKGYYVEYNTKIFADTGKNVESIVELLNTYETEGKNEWFTTTMEGNKVTVAVKGEKASTKIMTDIYKKGKTGIFVALDKFLSIPYITEFGTATLSISDSENDVENGKVYKMDFTFEDLINALKAVKNTPNSITKEEYKKIIKEGILLINTLVGKDASYANSLKSTIETSESSGDYTATISAELSLLQDITLGDLRDKKIDLEFEVGEELKQKTNLDGKQKYTVEFDVEPAEIKTKEELKTALDDENVDVIILNDNIDYDEDLTVAREGVTIEGEEGKEVTLKANLKINAANVIVKNLIVENKDYEATEALSTMSLEEKNVMEVSKSNATIENVTFRKLKTDDKTEKGTDWNSIIDIKANAEDIAIKNCTFEGNTETEKNGIFRNIILIEKDAGKNITISGNTFKQLGSIYNGIEFAWDYVVAADNKIVIKDNTFTNDIKHNSLSMYSFAKGAKVNIENNILAGVRFSNIGGDEATITFKGGQILADETANGPVTFQKTTENDNIDKLTVIVDGLKDKDGVLFSNENNTFAGYSNVEDGKKPTIQYQNSVEG